MDSQQYFCGWVGDFGQTMSNCSVLEGTGRCYNANSNAKWAGTTERCSTKLLLNFLTNFKCKTRLMFILLWTFSILVQKIISKRSCEKSNNHNSHFKKILHQCQVWLTSEGELQTRCGCSYRGRWWIHGRGPSWGGWGMAGDTSRMKRGAGGPHGGESAGGSYLSHPHHEPPNEDQNNNKIRNCERRHEEL